MPPAPVPATASDRRRAVLAFALALGAVCLLAAIDPGPWAWWKGLLAGLILAAAVFRLYRRIIRGER